MKNAILPLVFMLRDHFGNDPTSFHVPGHKGGEGMQEIWMQDSGMAFPDWLLKVMETDVTELSSTDDLHDPIGAIQQAQQMAADVFGAEETAFLVGGSTSGNLALLLGCCLPGELILLQRNVHKSILNGLQLSGARAVFLPSHFEETTGLAVLPDLRTVEEALLLYPEAKALFLSTPNYYGLAERLGPYADLVHRHEKMLLVDEAHGAHYGFHPGLPESALQAGADAVVQSTHKTLSALTMGAMLHMQGDRLDRKAVKQALTMVQSSSPSFPILASLDLARACLEQYGEDWFKPGMETAATIRSWLRFEGSSHPFRLMERNLDYSTLQVDPLRIVLEDASGLYSGLQLQRELEEHGCWAEMADDRYVVLVIGARSGPDVAETLIAALGKIARRISASRQEIEGNRVAMNPENGFGNEKFEASLSRSTITQASLSEPILFRRQRRNSAMEEKIPVKDSEGRIAAERITPYPPGIPLVFEGERIGEQAVSVMKRLLEAGARFQGMDESDRGWIKVVIEGHDQ